MWRSLRRRGRRRRALGRPLTLLAALPTALRYPRVLLVLFARPFEERRTCTLAAIDVLEPGVVERLELFAVLERDDLPDGLLVLEEDRLRHRDRASAAAAGRIRIRPRCGLASRQRGDRPQHAHYDPDPASRLHRDRNVRPWPKIYERRLRNVDHDVREALFGHRRGRAFAAGDRKSAHVEQHLDVLRARVR